MEWLKPWEATLPPGSAAPPATVRAMIRELRTQAKQGRALPFVVTYDRAMVGQLTVNGITWGSACWAQVGYWIDHAYAGRGIMPTAVALATDHCFFTFGPAPDRGGDPAGEHRLPAGGGEAGFPREGKSPRYLHIDGDWRDHIVFGLTSDEVPHGLLNRWLQS